jgi:GDP-L-fucose synthase
MLIENKAEGYSCAVTSFSDEGREKTLVQSSEIGAVDFLFEGAGQGCTFVRRKRLAINIGNYLKKNSIVTNDFYYPADLIIEDLMIEANVIHAAHMAGVQKLLFLGSSCIYLKEAEQPMSESALLTGALEPTNESYAIAKIAGIKLCESYNRQYGRDYRSVMPTNLYGPNDNFHPENSHVLLALMRRFHEAKESGLSEVVVWGSSKPSREFLHVDDMAAACVFVMNLSKEIYDAHTQPMLSHINVGTGEDCTIREAAETIARVVGY